MKKLVKILVSVICIAMVCVGVNNVMKASKALDSVNGVTISEDNTVKILEDIITDSMNGKITYDNACLLLDRISEYDYDDVIIKLHVDMAVDNIQKGIDNYDPANGSGSEFFDKAMKNLYDISNLVK